MFRHRADASTPALAYGHWFLMAANAGFTNASAFLGLGMFVTHVTGVATLFGVHAAQGELGGALTALMVLLFFLLGSVLAGYLVLVREEKGFRPRYDVLMVLAGLCSLAPSLLHRAGLGPSWGSNALALVLLCTSSGMQNSALGAASGQSVRVTHLTGLTTDLGLGLARLLAGPRSRAAKADAKLTFLQLGTISSFLLGSCAGALAWLRLGFDCFWIPALVCFYAALRGRIEAQEKI